MIVIDPNLEKRKKDEFGAIHPLTMIRLLKTIKRLGLLSCVMLYLNFKLIDPKCKNEIRNLLDSLLSVY